MASQRTAAAARALQAEATTLAAQGPCVVFISTHSGRDEPGEETLRQQCPGDLAALPWPLLMVLVDPMLEDPPMAVSVDDSWQRVEGLEDAWCRDAGRIRLLGLRLWATEEPQRPLGELCAGFDVADLCSTVLAAGGVLLLGCTGHVRSVWDAARPLGAALVNPWGRPQASAVLRQKIEGDRDDAESGATKPLLLDETQLSPCGDRCGAFHYEGPIASAL